MGLFSRRSTSPGTVPSGSGNRWEELLEEQPLASPDPEPTAAEPAPRTQGASGRPVAVEPRTRRVSMSLTEAEHRAWTQAAGGLLLAFGASAVCCYDTEERVRAWLEDYWKLARPLGIPVGANFEEFLRASDLMGVQRHLKVIGIFARICHRDGKPRYLADVPRFFSYIEAVLARRPELAELGELFASLPLSAEARA